MFRPRAQSHAPSDSLILVAAAAFRIIVGNNPGGTRGTPVTIAWTPVEEYCVPIDPYESAREGNRRPFENLRMQRAHRDMLLKKLGFPIKERMEGARVANIIRRQRLQSNAHEHRDAYYEQLEKMTRALKNAATLGRRNAKERRYLRTSCQSGVSMTDNSSTSFLPTSSEPVVASLKRHETVRQEFHGRIFGYRWRRIECPTLFVS